MDMISLEGKTNFFEKRVSEYKKAGVGESQDDHNFDNAFGDDTSF
jgi:ribonucleotide reductase beta subunit family protein with ferritin-like domain